MVNPRRCAHAGEAMGGADLRSFAPNSRMNATFINAGTRSFCIEYLPVSGALNFVRTARALRCPSPLNSILFTLRRDLAAGITNAAPLCECVHTCTHGACTHLNAHAVPCALARGQTKAVIAVGAGATGEGCNQRMRGQHAACNMAHATCVRQMGRTRRGAAVWPGSRA